MDHLLEQMFFQTVCSSADWVHPSARAFSAENKTDQIEDRGAKKKKKKKGTKTICNRHQLPTIHEKKIISSSRVKLGLKRIRNG